MRILAIYVFAVTAPARAAWAHDLHDELGHAVQHDHEGSVEPATGGDWASGAASSRGSWYIGFGLGSGAASLTTGSQTSSYGEIFEGIDSTRVSLDFQVGATLNEHLLVGGMLAAMREQAEFEGATLGLQHSQYLAAVTYFPMPDGTGLFVRGGAGLAAVTLDLRTSSGTLTAAQRGVGFVGGVGYAFWLGESFNLTVSNDFHYARFSGDKDLGEPTAGWFDAIQVGCMWY